MSPAPHRATSRRALLGGAGLVALTGCDLTEPRAGSSPGAKPAAVEPDRALVDGAAAEIADTLALVTAAARRQRRLARLLDGLVAMHEAHLEVLGGPPAHVSSPVVTGSAEEALTQVLRRERVTQRRLADWSVASASGQVARMFASMSAAVGQHLADADQRAGST